jgi:hypothetical protein
MLPRVRVPSVRETSEDPAPRLPSCTLVKYLLYGQMQK